MISLSDKTRLFDTLANRVKSRIGPGTVASSVAKVISGNLATSFITMGASMLVARWTDPREMGYWNAALLISIYSSVLQLGVFNGLNRQLPYLLGAGQRNRAVELAEAAYAWVLFLVAASILCGGGVLLYLWSHHRSALLPVGLALICVVASSWPTLYLTATYKTHNEFGRLSANTVAVAMAGAVLVLLVWRFSFDGLLARASLIAILGALALYWRRPMPVRPRWGSALLLQLARVGLPIWLVGQLGTFFTSLDRLSLVHSAQELGYFTIAIQVGTFVRMVPTAITMVLYPRMAESYGRTHNAIHVWQLARKGAVSALSIGVLVGICGWVLLPPVVHFVLPKYVLGIPAARLSAFLGAAAGLYIFDNVYNVIQRQDLYVFNWIIGCSTFAAVWFGLTLRTHVSRPNAAAASMLIATFVMALTSSAVSYRACRIHDERLRVQG